MSRLDYSKILFGDGMRRAVYSESVGVTSDLGQSSQTQMRYGTVTKDSWTDEATGQRYVEVLLDGSEDPVTIPCDSIFKIGDRVSALITGTNVKVMAIPDNIAEDAAQKAEEAVKEQIKADVEESLKPLEDSFNQFKEEQQLTNEQVSSQISDAVSTSEAALESATTATQTVDSFKTTVEQKFEDYDLGIIEMQTSIQQNADSIATEVTNREEAVEGAKSYANSLVTQSATEIRTEFNSYYETVDGQIAEFNSYIRESADGIEVGKTGGNYKALVNSSGSFDILDTNGSSVVSMSVLAGRARIVSPDYSSVALVSSGGSSVACASSDITLSTNAGKIYKSCGYTYTDYFESASNLSYTNVPGCILLYSGSTTGSVSLTVSSSYLAMITIVYSDGTRQMSQTVYSPSGKSVALFRSVPSSTTTYLQSEIVTISGSSISRGSNNQAILYNGGGIETSTSRAFYITYVIGWTG